MISTTEQEPSPRLVGAVANAASILRSLAQMREPAGVTAIARDTGVSVSTCFNILRTLATEQLVTFDAQDKTYKIGMGVLELSVPLLGVNQADIIRPELERLSDKHNSLICLWRITEEERILLIDRMPTAHTIHVDMPQSARFPAYAGAVGRCYAVARNIPREELKSHFETIKWQAPITFEEFFEDVEQAKRDGFALDLEQLFIGLEIAAAIVTDTAGKPRLGISGINIAGQLSRQRLKQLAIDLRDTTDWISEALFGVSRGVKRLERRAAATDQLEAHSEEDMR